MSVDFILSTISSIFFILNEFKYEEDKRLLGYVLIYELYKKRIDNQVNAKYLDSIQKNQVEMKNNQNINKSLSNQEINENRKEDIISNIDFSIFEEKWNEIKLEMKNKEAVVNALMMNTYPDRMENNDLIIMFPNGNKFHKENIMQVDKKIKVENIINKICGTNIKIKGEVEGELKKNSEDNFVNKVLTFFDGEILEKK